MLSGQHEVTINCDNQSALALSKNPTFHDRTKHIDVKFHFVRQIVQEGAVSLAKINTSHNPADMLTKSLLASRLNYLCDLLKLDFG